MKIEVNITKAPEAGSGRYRDGEMSCDGLKVEVMATVDGHTGRACAERVDSDTLSHVVLRVVPLLTSVAIYRASHAHAEAWAKAPNVTGEKPLN